MENEKLLVSKEAVEGLRKTSKILRGDITESFASGIIYALEKLELCGEVKGIKDEKFPKAVLVKAGGVKEETKDWSSYHFFIQKTAERILKQLQNEGLDEQDIKCFLDHFYHEVTSTYESKVEK